LKIRKLKIEKKNKNPTGLRIPFNWGKNRYKKEA